ncbi:DUF4357 domain-containing protein [Salegentibacter flavus]|uniref:Predicted ATP-dependent endonuclease of the OLD family, contains P-loop ATPase and TOPRIM domains n=1 Tax=Salegentibacter flavus TaxID=287099 RepID=A0A1I4YH90_9FLAO|nr:DUF4357 domain-containing protein [Salegentibacter flavus]SFN37398.1 Predicted ATP-dependent endonuclease of the OLD family, contains P-loop ATPase and TOPRIM domains [Salegentibacter flavus]
MKIKKLKIDGYKNLDFELVHSSDIVAIIGNNGSGKSNLLESLSLIFKSLYTENQSLSFDYEIEYLNSKNETIKINKSKSKLTFHKDDEDLVSIKDYLPKKVVAIYSGEEDRLWRKCFKPFYDDFIKDINKTKLEGILYSQTPQMLYLNKFYWHISLLSLALSNLDDNKDFIKKALGIDKIDKVKFDFNKGSYTNYSNSPTLEFIKKIDSKSEYTIPQLQKIFDKEGYIADDVYKHLYLAFTPKGSKIINDITIKFNQHLTIEDLSEGEKKLLLIKAAFEFAEQEDSLFILDEPDAHIHLNNKELIVKTFEPYKSNRQIVLTTHSPTITQAINEEELFMVDKGQIIDKKKQEIVNDLTSEFWNKHQQSSFLSSTKKLVLLVEGKHDKIHIKNAYTALKEQYKNIDFDIYSLGGESKIHPFMNGLYETDLKNNVTYIGIYDNDGAGKNTLKKAGFEPEMDNCGFRKLKEDKIKHNHFFAFPLIKPENFTADCTIENMYNSKKYEEAYKESLTKTLGNFKNKSIDDLNKSIKETSKNILAENSKNFDKEDFKYFKPLFSLLEKIVSNNSVVETKQDQKENQLQEANIFLFKNSKGVFNPEDESLTLLSGSKISKDYTPATTQQYKNTRDTLIQTLSHTAEETEIIINTEYKFSSPSGAAKFVNGGNRNGWTAWKNENNESLKDKYQTK